jgi:hypothetical protein
MVGLAAAGFEQDADATPVPVALLDGRLAPIVRPIGLLRAAVFVMVEDQAGEPIVGIRQDIHPA